MKFSVHYHDVVESGIDYGVNKEWIEQTAINNKIDIYNIKYILCSDEFLLSVNRNHLNHDYYTDVITFNLSTEVIDAEVYISMDRAEENAKELGVPVDEEVSRLMVHGLLHLGGLNDASVEEKDRMTLLEDEALAMRKNVSRETM